MDDYRETTHDDCEEKWPNQWEVLIKLGSQNISCLPWIPYIYISFGIRNLIGDKQLVYPGGGEERRRSKQEIDLWYDFPGLKQTKN